MTRSGSSAIGDELTQVGVLTPYVAPGPEVEFPTMAPGRIATRVARVSPDAAAARTGPPTPSDARMLTQPALLDDAAETLVADSVDVIVYASTSTAYAIGFDDEIAMTERLSQRFGIPVFSTCASAVLALRALDVKRMALVDPPWFDDHVTALGKAYFQSQAVQVVSAESANLSQDPSHIQPSDLHDWISRHVQDDAEAVFIAGNGFRAAAAIEGLEAVLGRPVLTSNQVLLWNLLAEARATFAVHGYGQIFAHQPPASSG